MPSMVILVLDNLDKLEDVLLAWWDAGSPGITILQSSGAGRYMAGLGARDDLPMFPGLRSLLGHREIHHRTLFTVLKSDEDVDRLFDATERVLGPLEQPNTGIIFALPVSKTRGRLLMHSDNE
jgi:nitrogen regulatory protein PII